MVDKEQQLARTAEHDYDRYKFVPALMLSSTMVPIASML